MSATSNSTEAVETVVDLLSGAASSVWTNADPDVYKFWGMGQQARMNNPNPALYVWCPTSTSYTEFDAEGSRLVEDRAAEIQAWTLDEYETVQYYNDMVDFFGEYMRDNYTNTNYHQIKPNAGDDLRNEHITRETDHYVATLTLDLSNLRVSGL